MTSDGRLDDQARSDSLHRMRSETLDVLVVGGGITGVGSALDAATRGLSVGLIERGDLAAGTSSKSSKLIHGGIRYLEQLNIGLVREALRERGILLHRIAPHLVQPVSFLMPLRHRIWERAYLGSGVMLYDRLGGAKQLPAGRHLSRSDVATIAPGLRPDAYVGGVQFWDAQEDDARFVTFVARTARAHGAAIATQVTAQTLTIENERVTGVEAFDSETGEHFTIRARHVVTALGAWTGDLLPHSAVKVRPSKGVHIVLPKSAIAMDTGLVARTDTGLIFVIPWDDWWLVGDTDTEWNEEPDCVRATRTDVNILLSRLNSQLATPVGADQIVGVFAGLRPLVAADSNTETVQLSREHAISSLMPGISAISGGKFTTYRAMAAQLIDVVVADLHLGLTESHTASTPLVGAEGFAQLWRSRRHIAIERELSVACVERLLRRYGACALEIFDLIDQDRELAESVHPESHVTGAEITYACTHESARHLDDVLERRTRLAIQTRDSGLAAVDRVAALMQRSLGWGDDVVTEEILRYRQLTAKQRQDFDITAPSTGNTVDHNKRNTQPCMFKGG
ncbi:glycerol-3-phosphate dehydrogenase/oxidase [Mycolicibacterium goodii]|uniref:glycerol-3-phosphate dehydrogenase/oxidase n=1 Tax=Mycolicibacterium goodii TaxID=134601 RepID=UPI000C264D0D|nr:glycerol-3-phosphate dehydrogenase/oxidase [Mycolicibacterium goodii]PJK20424.1 glycerol-3-phosphate dehydrogenase [Mycolicibacterium goodii]